jgi:hypothetical protein
MGSGFTGDVPFAHGLRRALLAVIDAAIGRRPLEGRERFQARFLWGASLLALLLACLNLAATLAVGLRVEAALTFGLIACVILQQVAFKLGARVSTIVWMMLATLGGYFTALPLTCKTLHPQKIFWLMLIPLMALVLVGPQRADREVPACYARAPFIAALVALLLGLLTIVAHGAGFAMGDAGIEEPVSFVAFTFTLFVAATFGLAFLYDLSLRETDAEVSRLRHALKMCRWCKKIHDEDAWVPLEEYLAEHQEADLHQGMCPACFERTFAVVAAETRPPRA